MKPFKNIKRYLLAAILLLGGLIILLFSQARAIQMQIENSSVQFTLLYVSILFIIFFIVFLLYFSYKLLFFAQNFSSELESIKQEKRQKKEEKNEEKQRESSDKEKELAGKARHMLPNTEKFSEVNQYAEQLLKNIANEMEMVQGIVYVKEYNEDLFTDKAKYAYFREEPPENFKLGETMPGQVAKNKKMIKLEKIPENYIKIVSGLGEASPRNLVIFPVILKDEAIGIIELAFFKTIDRNTEILFEKLAENLKEPLYKFYQKK